MKVEETKGTDGPAPPDPRRWRALAVLAAMQFMLILDITVVNVALPKIQHDLHFSHPGLAWVVSGFTLMAGGLLLVGGRLADMYGRRRIFLIGVFIFGAASAVTGAATTSSMLVAGRFAQGAGEALAAPAALGIIALLFTDPRERMKAMGIWGGIAALAETTGAIASGVLTDFASWRWIFFINIPVVLFALITVPRVISESRMIREGRRVDVVGAVTATGGLVAIVYGLLEAASHPWGSTPVLLWLLVGVGLLLVMVAWEARTRDPLVPLGFMTNRTRLTANLASLALMAVFFSYLFMLTLFMQQVLGFSPLKGGLAYVPVGVGLFIGMNLATKLIPRMGVKAVMAIGFLGSAAGMLIASFIQVNSAYASGILPGLIVFGVFSGLCYPGMMATALHRVTGQNSGLASGIQSTTLQIGAAIGLAALVPIALRYASDHTGPGTAATAALTHGFALSFRIGAVVLVVIAALVVVLQERLGAKPGAGSAQAPTAKEPTASSGAAR